MSTPAANLKINSSRLWDSLMEMAKIGLVSQVATTDKHSRTKTQKDESCSKSGVIKKI